MLRPLVAIALLAGLALPASSSASTTVHRGWALGAGARTRALVTPTHRYASFSIRFSVPHGDRYVLRLHDRRRALDVELMDTTTTACTVVGARDVCEAAYEPLRRGVYTWVVRKAAGTPAGTARLRVRW